MFIKIGSKKFRDTDQKLFANFSKDFNPIHVNEIESRKLIFGEQIVHGVNILLTALIFAKKNIKFQPKEILCYFYKPVFLNQKIEFFIKNQKEEINIYVKNNKSINCLITLKKNSTYYFFNKKRKNLNNKIINKVYKKKIIDFNFKDINLNNSYNVKKKTFKLGKKYKKYIKIFNKENLKDILSLSFFIGMRCPGKFSLLSKIKIVIDSSLKTKKDINFRIIKYDHNYNSYKINFCGTIYGEIDAFKYQRAYQDSFEKVKKRIKKNIYKNTKSLIIGGSRGLGELTSKILAAGNGNLALSYNHGKKEAKKIKREINRSTNNKCQIFKLSMPIKKLNKVIKKFINHNYIYYFITPKIKSNQGKNFDTQLYKKFNFYYVNMFEKICVLLDKYSSEKIKIFYPSSTYLNSNEKTFKEYIKSKKLAEKKIRLLNKKLKKVKISFFRIPPMQTDQNSGIFKKKINKNFDIFSPIINQFVGK